MNTAFRLAGVFAAHAVWSVSDSETLIPILAYTTEDGEQKMERLVSEDFTQSVAHGLERLATNEMDANDAVLLYDARIELEEDTMIDAILVELRCYFSPDSKAVLAIPYTPKSEQSDKFLVHKPKLLLWENCDDFDLDNVFSSFFEGVDTHPEGSKVWSESLDESK